MGLRFVSVVFLLLSSQLANAQQPNAQSNMRSPVAEFFSPLPKPTASELASHGAPMREIKWRPVVTIPAIKLTQSSRDNAKLDATILTQVGGGVSVQYLQYDSVAQRWDCYFSWSPLTVLLFGDTSKSAPLDISYATTVGFFNNAIMAGVGWDLGAVEGRKRFYGLLSIGINFNN